MTKYKRPRATKRYQELQEIYDQITTKITKKIGPYPDLYPEYRKGRKLKYKTVGSWSRAYERELSKYLPFLIEEFRKIGDLDTVRSFEHRLKGHPSPFL